MRETLKGPILDYAVADCEAARVPRARSRGWRLTFAIALLWLALATGAALIAIGFAIL